MEKRLQVGLAIEIAVEIEELDVGDEGRSGQHGFGVLVESCGGKTPNGHGTDAGEHEEQGGEDSADAAGVEIGEAELVLLEVLEDEAGDEEAGDDEEDVDADEAAGGEGDVGMVEDDEEDGDRPEALDIRTERISHG